MDWTITTAPLHEPVSLEQAKRHLRIDGSDSDQLIRSYIAAARQWCERYCNRAFLYQTVTVRMDAFADAIVVPVGPLVAVSSYKYIDTGGTEQTLAATVYDVDTTYEPGRILLAYNQTWPVCRGHHHDVRIACVVGHAKVFTQSGANLAVPGNLCCVDDPVQAYNIGGALPAGLTAGTQYYVKTVSGSIVTLATAETGTAVGLSGAGTGTQYIDALPAHLRDGILLKLTDLYMNRGDVDSTPSRAIRELLGIDRMVSI